MAVIPVVRPWVRTSRSIFLAIAIASPVICERQAFAQAGIDVVSVEIQHAVTKIEIDTNPGSRILAIKKIAISLSNSSPIVEGDIAALTRLLKDRSDLVRNWAAVALGRIGTRAESSVPSLKIALSEVDCVRADSNSRFAIRIALRRIGVTPPPEDCVATPGYGLKTRGPEDDSD
jgi:hypothetical protein